MDNYQKVGLISGQVFFGLVFGFSGVIVTTILGSRLEQLSGIDISDLSTTISYALYGGYVGMQIGIGYDGYKYLKGKGLLRHFKRFFAQSIVGLVLGLLILYYTNPFAFFFPMFGAIMGFDIGLVKKVSETEME